MSKARLITGATALGLAAVFGLSGFYIVETGEVGVQKTLGTVDTAEISEGMSWRMPIVTSVDTFVTKEISFDLRDLKPKAADNLSLADLDLTVYYKASADKIAELDIKYAGSRQPDGAGNYYPAYQLVYREARGAAYDEVSKIDSLALHKQREGLASSIAASLQATLDAKDQGDITVTRVIIRALNTDPSIEASIRLAVENEKKLEAKKLEVDIARQDAQIEIERAKGIAEANNIINASLTAEYLQHEVNMALQGFADGNGSVVVIPANMQGFDMILDGKALKPAK